MRESTWSGIGSPSPDLKCREQLGPLPALVPVGSWKPLRIAHRRQYWRGRPLTWVLGSGTYALSEKSSTSTTSVASNDDYVVTIGPDNLSAPCNVNVRERLVSLMMGVLQ